MSNPFPYVSLLMPTKNRRKFIAGAVQMALNQDYPGEMELVVIEDGDQRVERLLMDCAATFKRHRNRQGFKVSYHHFTGTLGAKLNFGADAAKGDVFINYDDDDWNAPNRVSQQLAHMALSGKPFVGMSSLIFHDEGEDFGWEYTGDAWYAPGSTHCYTREYALAFPRPDMTVGEDNVAVEGARQRGALSTVSGLTSLVARNHTGNCSARIGANADDPQQAFFLKLRDAGLTDQYKKIPLDKFRATLDAAR